MANEEHLAILRQGVEVWNGWREENPDVRPDLSDANLRGVDLGFANFFGTDLSRADLSSADFSEANLTEAVLRKAVLSHAKFSETNLSRADLGQALLQEIL